MPDLFTHYKIAARHIKFYWLHFSDMTDYHTKYYPRRHD